MTPAEKHATNHIGHSFLHLPEPDEHLAAMFVVNVSGFTAPTSAQKLIGPLLQVNNRFRASSVPSL